jgi:hypothetical protein
MAEMIIHYLRCAERLVARREDDPHGSTDVHVPIGARMIGTLRPRSSHRCVFNIVLPP